MHKHKVSYSVNHWLIICFGIISRTLSTWEKRVEREYQRQTNTTTCFWLLPESMNHHPFTRNITSSQLHVFFFLLDNKYEC